MAILRRGTKGNLGEILVAEGILSQEQLKGVAAEPDETGAALANALIEANLITERDLARALVGQFSMPYLALSNYDVDLDLCKLLPLEKMRLYHFVPIDRFGDTLVVATALMPHEGVIKQIEKHTGMKVSLYITEISEVKGVLDRFMERQEEEKARAAKRKKMEEKPAPPVEAPKAPEAVPEAKEKKPAPAVADEWENLVEKKEDAELLRELEKSFRGTTFETSPQHEEENNGNEDDKES